MKIIKVDNFNRESISDVLIAENVSEYYAKHITFLLNEKFGSDNSPNFYRSVENDYKLYKFEPWYER